MQGQTWIRLQSSFPAIKNTVRIEQSDVYYCFNSCRQTPSLIDLDDLFNLHTITSFSFTFGPEVVSKFLNQHDLDLICRAHQVVEDGYEFFAKRQLVTLFSAPNYCGEFDNAGAMMTVDETLMCSFQILKPSDKKKFTYGTSANNSNSNRPITPPRSTNNQTTGKKGKKWDSFIQDKKNSFISASWWPFMCN